MTAFMVDHATGRDTPPGADADARHLVVPDGATGQNRRSSRLHGDNAHTGLACFQHLADARDRAAGATADTKTSMAPCVSSQTSTAVVRRCTSGLAGFVN